MKRGNRQVTVFEETLKTEKCVSMDREPQEWGSDVRALHANKGILYFEMDKKYLFYLYFHSPYRTRFDRRFFCRMVLI